MYCTGWRRNKLKLMVYGCPVLNQDAVAVSILSDCLFYFYGGWHTAYTMLPWGIHPSFLVNKVTLQPSISMFRFLSDAPSLLNFFSLAWRLRRLLLFTSCITSFIFCCTSIPCSFSPVLRQRFTSPVTTCKMICSILWCAIKRTFVIV